MYLSCVRRFGVRFSSFPIYFFRPFLFSLLNVFCFVPFRFFSFRLVLFSGAMFVQTARATKAAVGTPAYVYDAASLKANAEACLAFPNAYGLTVRYAMKSLPNKAVVQLFHRCDMHEVFVTFFFRAHSSNTVDASQF